MCMSGLYLCNACMHICSMLIHVCIYLCGVCACGCMRAVMCIMLLCMECMCACIHACMCEICILFMKCRHVRLYVYIYIHVCMYACRVRMHRHTYVMYICMWLSAVLSPAAQPGVHVGDAMCASRLKCMHVRMYLCDSCHTCMRACVSTYAKHVIHVCV